AGEVVVAIAAIDRGRGGDAAPNRDAVIASASIHRDAAGHVGDGNFCRRDITPIDPAGAGGGRRRGAVIRGGRDGGGCGGGRCFHRSGGANDVVRAVGGKADVDQILPVVPGDGERATGAVHRYGEQSAGFQVFDQHAVDPRG